METKAIPIRLICSIFLCGAFVATTAAAQYQPDYRSSQPFANQPSFTIQDVPPPVAQPQQPSHVEQPKEAEAPPPPPQKEVIYHAVRLQGLEKITARRQRFDAQMGVVTRFGNLEIVPRACWQAPDSSQRPENAALLEIWYWKPGEQPSMLFFGWMFSSSPGLSSLAHSVYDVTVLECLPKPEEEEKAEKKKADAPAAKKPTKAKSE